MPLYRWEIIRRKKPLIGPQIHDVSQVLYLPFDKDHEPYSVEPYDPTQVLRLPFEDPPQEITYDRSGHGNDGTIYGATRVIGKVRNALKFDGVDDYVYTVDKLKDAFPEITFTLWVKVPDGTRTFEMLIARGSSWSTGAICIIKDQYKKTLRLEFFDLVPTTYFGTLDFADGTWHHLAITIGGGALKSYVDGVLDIDATYTGSIQASDEGFKFGIRSWVAQFPLKGVMDEVRIYNRALSAAEIKLLMNLRGV